MADVLRVGIAGANRGRFAVEPLAKSPRTVLTAFCDTDEARLAHLKAQIPGLATFADYAEMLDSGIDLVVVATPAHLHVPQSVAALARGIHVFSEVPAAISLEQCRDLVVAARASSAKYMMGENCCFMKEHMIVKNMASAGRFGELYYAEGSYVHEMRTFDRPGGWREEWLLNRRGATYITHALGPILEWLDDRVVCVNCVGTGSWVEPRHAGDDCSITLCRTSRGALIQLRNDMKSPRPFRGYAAVQGTLGAYEPDWEHGEGRVCLAEPGVRRAGERRTWRPISDFEADYLPQVWRTSPADATSQPHGGADDLTLLAFVEAIVSGSEPPIDVYRALDFTVPGLVSETSAHQGGMPVAVPDFRHM